MGSSFAAEPAPSSPGHMRIFHVREPFDQDDWIFEIKYDGFRSLARRIANGLAQGPTCIWVT
jgi:hypothetical protein